MAKILTYEQFKKTVPVETMKFINNLLPYLHYYLIRNYDIEFMSDKGRTTDSNYKAYIIMSSVLSKLNDNYQSILASHNYNPSFTFNLNKTDNVGFDLAKTFNDFSSLFCVFDNEYDYIGLTPSKIFLNILDKINFNNTISIFSYDDLRRLHSFLETANEKEVIEIKQSCEEKLYNDLPIDTVKYLESVSKLHILLDRLIKCKSFNRDLISDNEEDLYSLARIYALYFHNKKNVYLSAIVSLLEKQGLTLDSINKLCNFSIGSNEVKSTESNVLILEKYYKQYIFDGKNKNKDSNKIKVEDIFMNLLDRKFNNSLVFEKIVSNVNCDINIFNDFDKQIQSEMKEQELTIKRKVLDEFYQELTKECRDYIDFTSKCYVLISEKLSQNKQLSLIKDDVDTLALLVSSYYFNTNVAMFFSDNGISLEKILKLFGLDINKQEICETDLDESILINIYKRFVYEGVNRGKNSKYITINDISDNLCSMSFNKSAILEDIFNKLSKESTLESDFRNQMNKFLEEKKEQKDKEIYQEFFKNVPIDTIKYLENVSQIHQYLISLKLKCNKKDIVVLSLLLGTQSISSEDEVRNLFKSLGITRSKVFNYLNSSTNNDNYFSNNRVDVNILKEHYGKFIFGGNNKDKTRDQITIYDIASNIFNKELYNSVEIQKMLDHFGQSYDSFSDFDLVYQNFKEKQEQERIAEEKKELEEKVKSLLKWASHEVINYLKQVICIHKIIIKQFEEKKCNFDIINNTLDIEKLSMLLAMFYFKDNESTRFLLERNLNFDSICDYCKLDKKLFDSLPLPLTNPDSLSNELDSELLLENYKKYISSISLGCYEYQYSYVKDFAKLIFDSNVNKSPIIEKIALQFCTNYNDLKIEIETGEKVIPVLSNEERLAIINNEIIPNLDFMDRKSILMFSDAMAEHSKFIHTKLPSLEMSDTHEKSIQTISEILNGMYEKEQIVDENKKNKNFWLRLFTKTTDDANQAGKIVLRDDAIATLKNALDENINLLKQELLEYDFMQEYIRIYRSKNLDSYDVVKKAVEELDATLFSIDKDDDRQYEKVLTVSANLQILNNKLKQIDTSNHLMKQELLKINQTIINHFITISALEMARDDLLPLMGSELAINKGKDTENQALELSSNIVNLFKAILVRNVGDTVENMEKLKDSSIDNSVLALLHTDVSSYLEQLDSYKQVLLETENFKDNNSLGLEFDSNLSDTKSKVKKKLL